MKHPFDIIATRTIDILDEHEHPVRRAFVYIGRPWQEPTGEWALPYHIVGIGQGKISLVFGFDAIQALQSVQLVIGAMLASSTEGKQGHLRWAGESDLGFPVPAASAVSGVRPSRRRRGRPSRPLRLRRAQQLER